MSESITGQTAGNLPVDERAEARSAEDARTWPERLRAVEAWLEKVGDSLNPILVKETRQALKSRQFLITFSLLLVASFGWSVAGSLMQMPAIYYRPSAPQLLVGYYLILAVPMLFVVPLAAYRSLAAEIDDGTLELLRVTTLTPMQIVVGKLCSALLQMMLYFVTLIPCVAYAYALRGTDLPTLIALLELVLLAAVQMTVFGLFLAPLSTGRAGQLTALIALVGALTMAEYVVGIQAIVLILQADPLSPWATIFLSFGGVALVATNSYLLMSTAAAVLAPACANRSTKVRVALLVQQLVFLGLLAYAVVEIHQPGRFVSIPQFPGLSLLELVVWIGIADAVYWALIGSMMAAESPVLTPRVRRELPRSFVGRAFLTFLMPGPSTGVVLAILGAASALLFVWGGIWYLEARDAAGMDRLAAVSLAVFGYLAIFLVITRWAAILLRRVTDFRPSVGLALLVVLALVAALVPYSLYMVIADFPSQPNYSYWQLPNWAWTIGVLVQSPGRWNSHWFVFGAGVVFLLGHLAFLGPIVMPQRIPTPVRVEREQQRIRGSRREDEPEIDPLALEEA